MRGAGERGASAVEATLLMVVVLIPLVLGALDLGRALWVKVQLTNAAREGAGFAQLGPNLVEATGGDGECADPHNIEFRALQESSEVGALTAEPSVSVIYPPTGTAGSAVRSGCKTFSATPGASVEVRVSGEVRLLTPGISSFFDGNPTISGISVVRIMEGT